MSREDNQTAAGSAALFLRGRVRRNAVVGSGLFAVRNRVIDEINPDQYREIGAFVLGRIERNEGEYTQNDFDQAISTISTAAHQFEKDGRIDDAKKTWEILTKPPITSELIRQQAQANYSRLNGLLIPHPPAMR